MTSPARRWLPALDWARGYDSDCLRGDLSAALVVTIILLPQSLAFALLAGMPPVAGVYAATVPLLLYAAFGGSRALSVGPAALVSLISAAALGQVAAEGAAGYAAAALTLAALSGGVLLALGLCRLGFLASFLSYPVFAGFAAAAGLLMAAGQLEHLLGVGARGGALFETLGSVASHQGQADPTAFAIGVGAIGFLLWAGAAMGPALRRSGASNALADLAVTAGPLAVVLATAGLAWLFDLSSGGAAASGSAADLGFGLPPLTWPAATVDLIAELFAPALLIALIGYVEALSTAQALAAKKRERVDADQELIGLGLANLGAAFSGGFPVGGDPTRSDAAQAAGARTPAAGAFAAFWLVVTATALAPLIAFLPNAALAAIIVVTALSLIDVSVFRKSWSYSRADFAAATATMLATLAAGLETGVAAGVALSLLLRLYKSSRPHVAVVGVAPGTQHFRDVARHEVVTHPMLLTLRIDESLIFANARVLEEIIQDRVTEDDAIRHVVLMCSGVNEIDLSALETLKSINTWLRDQQIGFHLSELQEPVLDRLQTSDLLATLGGFVFSSQYEAMQALVRPQRRLRLVT